MASFSGKVVLITGASSGIGAKTALNFAQSGAKLSFSGRNETKLTESKQACIDVGGASEDSLLITVSDVTNEEDLKNLVQRTIDKFGKLDVLINVAGLASKNGSINGPIEEYDKIMSVNLRSVIALCKLCIPYLVETKGAIVNVSSLAGTRPIPKVLYYCLSKAGLDQLTKCLALELAPKGVRVNSVNPAVTRTDFFIRNECHSTEEVDKFYERSKETHPLGRIAEPDEIAKSIVFLASDQASFTTGQISVIDGGRSLVVPR